MYLAESLVGFLLYFLYKKVNVHPFRLMPILVGLGGLGFLLMLVTPYIPSLSFVVCTLIGCGMVSCIICPLYGIVIMNSYPSRYISSCIIGLALVAVLLHSFIAELFLGAPAMLYLTYAVIMVFLVFIFMQAEPFLLFALRRRNTDHNAVPDNDVPVSNDIAESVSEEEKAADPLDILTPKEREVAELICMGYTNADIAKLMFITENTVKDHTKKIYPKMGVHSRFELATLVSRYRAEEK